MATDVNTQFFSNLNGLKLTNTWGDLIRLLDKALVTGIDFTQITAASIDAQGDVHITLYSAHNAMLFQVVELSGFTPNSLNQKYRIKGVANTTQLILKPALDIAERSITTIGAGKLASLGYEIIFRDVNDVKRVYRAKNPTAQHPFIRVDESISSGDGTYNAAYCKSAMVGLIENMTHIDDYESTDNQQLPFLPANPSKNWKITGTGTSVVRGWSKWFYAVAEIGHPFSGSAYLREATAPAVLDRQFTLFGDKDAFYLNRCIGSNDAFKSLSGCGLYESSLPLDITPNWFIMSMFWDYTANFQQTYSATNKGMPLGWSETLGAFMIPKYGITKPTPSIDGYGLMPNWLTGSANIYSANNNSALEIPIYDPDKYLRGSLKHVHYSGKKQDINTGVTTPMIFESSMYLWETIPVSHEVQGGVMVYLGELE